MPSLNKCSFIGNLTKDPEIRSIPSGDQVANFTIAVNERYKNKNGQDQDKTQFINCVVWKGLVSVVERFLKKGNSVYVEGKHSSRTWEKPDGSKGYAVDYTISNLQLLTSKSENTESQDYTPPAQIDDLPF